MTLREKIQNCKLPPLTRRQKILRNLILILLAVCVLAMRPRSEYVRTSDAALDRALNKQLGMLQPYEIIADYTLPEDMDFFHREVYVRTSVQDKPQIVIVRIQKHEDGRYSPYFDPKRYTAWFPWPLGETAGSGPRYLSYDLPGKLPPARYEGGCEV